jgi:hypothetical protein
MVDHRTVSLGLMGKLFDKAGAGTVIIGSVDEINWNIETPEIEWEVDD